MACAVAALIAGCGSGGENPAAPEKPVTNARSATVQREVARQVQRRTERQIEDATGSFVDPELEPTKTDCIPESDTKLSCVVEARPGKDSRTTRCRMQEVRSPYAGR